MPQNDDLRTQISKILTKWDMPTRQSAISEIEAYIATNYFSKDEILKTVQSMHEYSLTDIELLEHQTKTEHPMISKLKLVKALGVGEYNAK